MQVNFIFTVIMSSIKTNMGADMVKFERFYSKLILVGVVSVSLLALASCETPSGISKTNRDYYHHNRGNEVAVINPLPIYPNSPPPQEEVREVAVAPAHHHHAQYDHTTHFDGCTGTFSLADEHSGRVLLAGQGISTQEGIIVLDGRGNRTSQVVNNTVGQSLIFQPNCGCNSNAAQNVETYSTSEVHGGTCQHH